MSQQTDHPKQAALDVSVIVPLYNAAPTLRPCLDSVFASSGVSFEVILVNDCSTDDSVPIALEYPCRVVSLAKNIMAANCRNLGAKFARGEILIFFDSDQVMRPDTLAQYVSVLRSEPEIDAVVGSFQHDTPMKGFYSKFKNLRHHYVHQIANPEGATLASGLTAIRRCVFEEMGGFEPAYQAASIEDIALGYKLRRAGRRIRYAGHIQVTHLKGYTLWELVRSDIVNRAIPWVGLMIRDRIWRNDLNTKGGNIMSVALSWLIPPLPIVLGLRLGGAVVGLCLLLIWLSNAGILAAARRHFGFFFMLASMLFLPFMYFYQGIGLIAGLVAYAAGRSVNVPRRPPQPQYEIIEGPSHSTLQSSTPKD